MAKIKSGRWIYTAYITLRDGRRLYARWYGLRAFRIWIET